MTAAERHASRQAIAAARQALAAALNRDKEAPDA